MCDLLSPLPMDEDEIFVAHMSSTEKSSMPGWISSDTALIRFSMFDPFE